MNITLEQENKTCDTMKNRLEVINNEDLDFKNTKKLNVNLLQSFKE